MKKIVTFGEIMLRLAPNGYNRFFKMTSFRPRLAAAKPMWRYLWQTTACAQPL